MVDHEAARMASDRHTRRVRVLRVLLPLTALGLIASVFLFPRSFLTADFGLSGLSFDPSEGLRLTNPHMTGSTDDGRRYRIVADWALPDAPDPSVVELGPLRGELARDAVRTLTLRAAAGTYRPEANRLRLEGDVTVDSGDGHSLEVRSADVDFAMQRLSAAGPVLGRTAMGTIEAGSMRAERGENGDLVWFEDRVRVIVTPRGGP